MGGLKVPWGKDAGRWHYRICPTVTGPLPVRIVSRHGDRFDLYDALTVAELDSPGNEYASSGFT